MLQQQVMWPKMFGSWVSSHHCLFFSIINVSNETLRPPLFFSQSVHPHQGNFISFLTSCQLTFYVRPPQLAIDVCRIEKTQFEEQQQKADKTTSDFFISNLFFISNSNKILVKIKKCHGSISSGECGLSKEVSDLYWTGKSQIEFLNHEHFNKPTIHLRIHCVFNPLVIKI